MVNTCTFHTLSLVVSIQLVYSKLFGAIIDFGFAHYLIGETASPYLRGSPLYMAPEMVLIKQYDERADLWSVGVILYGKAAHFDSPMPPI